MDEKYMKEALRLAKKAAALGEVPVGAVIVHNCPGVQPTGDGSKRAGPRGADRYAAGL